MCFMLITALSYPDTDYIRAFLQSRHISSTKELTHATATVSRTPVRTMPAANGASSFIRRPKDCSCSAPLITTHLQTWTQSRRLELSPLRRPFTSLSDTSDGTAMQASLLSLCGRYTNDLPGTILTQSLFLIESPLPSSSLGVRKRFVIKSLRSSEGRQKMGV